MGSVAVDVVKLVLGALTAVGTLFAVWAAVYAANRAVKVAEAERADARKREVRDREFHLAQDRLDQLVATHLAFEEVQRLRRSAVQPYDPDAAPQRDLLAASARFQAMLRSCEAPLLLSRHFAFQHIPPQADDIARFDSQLHDLGAASGSTFDPESEGDDIRVVRTELLEAIESARRERRGALDGFPS